MNKYQKPNIYCKRCSRFKNCKYVKELKNIYKSELGFNPVLYTDCSEYSPINSQKLQTL